MWLIDGRRVGVFIENTEWPPDQNLYVLSIKDTTILINNNLVLKIHVNNPKRRKVQLASRSSHCVDEKLSLNTPYL